MTLRPLAEMPDAANRAPLRAGPPKSVSQQASPGCPARKVFQFSQSLRSSRFSITSALCDHKTRAAKSCEQTFSLLCINFIEFGVRAGTSDPARRFFSTGPFRALEREMRKSIKLGMLALLASTALVTVRAEAASVTNPNAVRAAIDDLSMVDTVQAYYFGGRQYCWYDDAWQGPGWYWCGYAWRRGYGWGGGYGWRNWAWHGRSRYWSGGRYQGGRGGNVVPGAEGGIRHGGRSRAGGVELGEGCDEADYRADERR